MWLSILALFFSALALLSSVWLFSALSVKLSKGDLESQLASSSLELSKKYASSVKEIEMEWANMYEKFARLAGRMDRKKFLEAPAQVQVEPEEPRQMKRSDLLRGRIK